MTAPADLRRATAADIPALTALQRAAYARNRDILGVEPLPLRADYDAIFANYETWLAEESGALLGALILEPRPNDLLIWSVATTPSEQGRGLGIAGLNQKTFDAVLRRPVVPPLVCSTRGIGASFAGSKPT